MEPIIVVDSVVQALRASIAISEKLAAETALLGYKATPREYAHRAKLDRELIDRILEGKPEMVARMDFSPGLAKLLEDEILFTERDL